MRGIRWICRLWRRWVQAEQEYSRACAARDNAARCYGKQAMIVASRGLAIVGERGDVPGRWAALRAELLAARKRGRDEYLQELRLFAAL